MLTPPPFGILLRRYRIATGLTQAALATRARLSPRTLRSLENGERRAPRFDTIRLITDALGLTAAEHALFLAAARAHVASEQSTLTLTPPTNVPAVLTPLLGRDDELSAVVTRLHQSQARLITLTGAPGVGKTRLALSVAQQSLAHFADGVFFVPLEAIRDPALLLPTIARTLIVGAAGNDTILDTFCDFLGDKHLLLVLDNFEQLVISAPILIDIMGRCQRLHLLITSRVGLQVRGEWQMTVLPLPTPDPAQITSDVVSQQSAVMQLFAQRAQMVTADFTYTATNMPVVAAICQRLDGLPLAIELAAARVQLLPVQELLRRLDRRLDLLTDGARDLPLHQQTLRAALAWSYDLLDAQQQLVFRHMAVVRGECTLETISALLDAPDAAILTAVAQLVNHHLVQQREALDGVGFVGMLETIHEYAYEQLVTHGELALAQRRYADFYMTFVEQAEIAMRGAEQQQWLTRLGHEYPNIHAVLVWAYDHEETTLGLCIAGSLDRFWRSNEYRSEGRLWLDRFLSLDQTLLDAAIRIKALRCAGNLALMQGDLEHALAYYTTGLHLSQDATTHEYRAGIFLNLGNIAYAQGDTTHAHQHILASLAIYRETADQGGIALAVHNLGLMAHAHGEYVLAQQYAQESLHGFQSIGDTRGIAMALNSLGLIASAQRDFAHSQALYEESFALQQRMGDLSGMANTLDNLGCVAGEQGALSQAMALYQESLVISQRLGDINGITMSCDDLAHGALQQHDPQRATCLYAAAAAMRVASGMSHPLHSQARYDQDVAALKATLGDPIFAAAWARGEAMSRQEAIAFALSEEEQEPDAISL